MLTGGPPCQKVCPANAKAKAIREQNGGAIEDDGGADNIWVFLEFVVDHGISLFMFEESPNLLSLMDPRQTERYFIDVLREYMIVNGWQITFYIANAAYFGSPQGFRNRVIVVGAKEGRTLPRPPVPAHSVKNAKHGFASIPKVFKGAWLEPSKEQERRKTLPRQRTCGDAWNVRVESDGQGGWRCVDRVMKDAPKTSFNERTRLPKHFTKMTAKKSQNHPHEHTVIKLDEPFHALMASGCKGAGRKPSSQKKKGKDQIEYAGMYHRETPHEGQGKDNNRLLSIYEGASLMSMDDEFIESINVKFASSLKTKYSSNQVFDRMWKQIGNAVDGRLAKAIGDTFLAATLEDLRRQPSP